MKPSTELRDAIEAILGAIVPGSTESYMIDTARLYSCLRCNSQVTICRRCDRGNVYCMKCAPKARQEAKDRAATRYQASYRGRSNHAARQRRYRESLKQKVTHKGSKGRWIHDLLINKRKNVKLSSRLPDTSRSDSIFCHSCRSCCSAFLRRDFLLNTADPVSRPDSVFVTARSP